MYKTSLLLLNFCLYLYITNLHNVLERVSCSYLHKISRIECHSYFVIVCYLAVPLSAEFQLREVYPELLDAVADCISYEFIEVGLELGFKVEQILQFRMQYNSPLQTNREMLREWHKRNKREGSATIAWLTHCLLNTRSDIGALIEMEEKAAKSNKSGCVAFHDILLDQNYVHFVLISFFLFLCFAYSIQCSHFK